jgi:hypothetical protein
MDATVGPLLNPQIPHAYGKLLPITQADTQGQNQARKHKFLEIHANIIGGLREFARKYR